MSNTDARNLAGARKVAPSNDGPFTASEWRRIADYLQLAQQDVLCTAKYIERSYARSTLVARLDGAASDIADIRTRVLTLARLTA